jgi:hypothetical protein
MLSRWRMQEQHGGERGLPEVQYVFLELPKYEGGRRPRNTVEKWAYFFRAAPSLDRVPEELAEGPYAQALEVARTANLSEEEWTDYERQKMAEQDYRGGLSLAEQRGREEEARAAVLDLCEVLDIEVTAAHQAHLMTLDLAALTALRRHLKAQRAWPDPAAHLSSR